jgi:hypothetical protein
MLSLLFHRWKAVPQPHRILILASIAWTIGLIAASPWLHPIEGLRGESDHYTVRAEHLRNGVITDDKFHPFLFIELTCLVSFFTGDAFVAGRTVSSIFAGILLYFSSRMALALLGAFGCFWTFVLMAANPHYFILGMQAASDVTGASLLIWAIWRTFFVGTDRTQALLTGISWGLAISTRFNFVLLLPIAAILALRTRTDHTSEPRIPPGRQWLIPFSCGALLGYLPNMIPTLLASGTLYQTYNWRNLSLKASGNWNPAHLYCPPYADAADLLMQQGMNLLRMGFADMFEYWNTRLGEQLLGIPRLPWASQTASAAIALSTLWSLIQKRSTTIRQLASILVAGTASVAFTFHTDMRLMLFALPLGTICLLAAIHAAMRERCAYASAILGLPLVLFANSAPRTLQEFYDHHPFEEVALAQQLSATIWRLDAITCGMSTMGRYIHNPTTLLHVNGLESASAKAWLGAAEKAARTQASSLILCGPKTSGFTVDQFLDAIPSDYEVVMRNDKALALRLPAIAGNDWQAHITAKRISHQDVSFELNVDSEQTLHAVGILFIMDDADDVFLRLEPKGQGKYAMTTSIADSAKGAWNVVAHAIKEDGSVIRAKPTIIRPD